MRDFMYLWMAAMVITLNSCKDDREMEIVSNEDATEISTRSITPMISSDEYKSQLQSDKELMLIDQILFRDSVYILNLSMDEAKLLEIPDTLYERYQDIVSDMNQQRMEEEL